MEDTILIKINYQTVGVGKGNYNLVRKMDGTKGLLNRCGKDAAIT